MSKLIHMDKDRSRDVFVLPILKCFSFSFVSNNKIITFISLQLDSIIIHLL